MSGLNFKNSFIPKINHPTDYDNDLHDVFARHTVEEFVNGPVKYLKNTRVV